MPFNLPTANKGGDAPKVDDGLAVLRFDDLKLKAHPEWAETAEQNKFGKADSGDRFHFEFTLFTDDAKEVIYGNDGDPVAIDTTTSTATGEKSNFAALLSGILTAKEYATWQAATEDDPFDGSAAQGRLVNAKIAHNKAGWPFVESVIGPVKVK